MNKQNTKSTDHTSQSHQKEKHSSLRLVAWETTRNCNLACIHCRASATTGPYSGELDTQARQQALENFRQTALDNAILEKAYVRAQEEIARLLLLAGYKTVEFAESDDILLPQE